ncbi:MAG: hypothetical protein NE327_15180 [Lentisphaeraceae bacterium]|nr:hypothetical protein [Lentisphaeraceae bacterium]
MTLPILFILLKLYYEKNGILIHDIYVGIGSVELDTKMIVSLSMTIGVLLFTLATLSKNKKDKEVETK